MTKTKTQRDANKIVTIVDSILASDGFGAAPFVDDREALIEIRRLAKGLDASTGKRDSSTKSRRSRAAKKGLAAAGRKRVTR